MKKNNLILGLDLGIGSIGWGLISCEKGKERIIDFGVRLFESGEIKGGAARTSQQRRRARGARRLVRRRSLRKETLKTYLESIGLVKRDELEDWYKRGAENIYELRARALDEKVAPWELAAILIHISNHRGYKAFYEIENEELITEDLLEEIEEDKLGVDKFKSIFKSGAYRTVGEMYFKDKAFRSSDGRLFVRNKETRAEKYLPTREDVEAETGMILKKQSLYHECLNEQNISKIIEIIFRQRDFEDGPGNKDDEKRKYKGFIDSVGKCIFYGEKRGFRGTVIADVYAVINTLSQYTFVDNETGEVRLDKDLAKELIDFLLTEGNLTKADLKKIARKHNVTVHIKEASSDMQLSKCIKYIKNIKKIFEASGYSWNEIVSEPQFDLEKPSKLHLVGETLSKYQTLKRRREELKRISFLNDSFVKNAMAVKFSGTSNVCYRYMIDAINSFLNGKKYGDFQAEKIKELKVEEAAAPQEKLPCITDEHITKNPVVFRTINEARKVINAVIQRYGLPETINVEVASEVNRSYEERLKIRKQQNENEKNNDRIKKEISELYKINIEDVTATMIERYKLYEQQEGKCLYSDMPIIKERLMENIYEIDHIVPYSLILDNTLDNKALVLRTENQTKRQRTPLEYLSGERAEIFKAKVNAMINAKKISEKKYRYLMLPNTYDKECVRLLEEWKSRNMNDTRYITKYIISYIKSNLCDVKVHGVKGAYTAKFRRIWLNKETWGEKTREESNLHHAVDAIVAANLTPAYLEIASDNLKLYQIYKSAKKRITDEYTDYLERCVKKMERIYGFPEDYSRKLLSQLERVPSAIPNLRDEVDIRFNDKDPELFNKKIRDFYKDEEFVKTLSMPLVSYKQNKKLQGEITDSNPLKIKEIDGKLWEVKRTSVSKITKKQLDKIVSSDKDLLETLSSILKDKSDDYSVGKYLEENNLPHFVTNKGTRVNKVTVKEKQSDDVNYKVIGESNRTALATSNYYCVEVYEDVKGKTRVRGIKRYDVALKDKKIYLKCGYPEGYAKHVMYIFPGDYIAVKNKDGKIKAQGFYRGVENINQSRLYIALDNKVYTPRTDFVKIALADSVEKYYVDILGKRGGKIKCGEPFSLLTEKK